MDCCENELGDKNVTGSEESNKLAISNHQIRSKQSIKLAMKRVCLRVEINSISASNIYVNMNVQSSKQNLGCQKIKGIAIFANQSIFTTILKPAI